jgi:hypothetical protein
MIQYVMVKQYALNAFWLETINIEFDSIISNHILGNSLSYILRPNLLVEKGVKEEA